MFEGMFEYAIVSHLKRNNARSQGILGSHWSETLKTRTMRYFSFVKAMAPAGKK